MIKMILFLCVVNSGICEDYYTVPESYVDINECTDDYLNQVTKYREEHIVEEKVSISASCF